MKEKRFTPNVPGSARSVTAQNGRKMMKVKCASYGIRKTRFVTSGTALARLRPRLVDKIAEGASMFSLGLSPTFAMTAAKLGSQAYKSISKNVKYYGRR